MRAGPTFLLVSPLAKCLGLSELCHLGKTPNSKHQTPEKSQTPNLQCRGRFLDWIADPLSQGAPVWNLELGASLVFGVWCLVFRHFPFNRVSHD